MVTILHDFSMIDDYRLRTRQHRAAACLTNDCSKINTSFCWWVLSVECSLPTTQRISNSLSSCDNIKSHPWVAVKLFHVVILKIITGYIYWLSVFKIYGILSLGYNEASRMLSTPPTDKPELKKMGLKIVTKWADKWCCLITSSKGLQRGLGYGHNNWRKKYVSSTSKLDRWRPRKFK